MYPENTSFSPEEPMLQLTWDSTSYGTFKECPFKYYLSIIQGYEPTAKSPHLAFGIAFHSAAEHYHKLIAQNIPHEQALIAVVGAAYKNQLDSSSRSAIPAGHPKKNSITLLRSIVWYIDQFNEQNENTKTLILSNGKPAVELSFRFRVTDEFEYAGHLDRLVEYNGANWATDYKTTGSTLNSRFFDEFHLDIQMTGYILSGQVAFSTPLKGIIVDAMQVGATFTDFARLPIRKTGTQLEEFLTDMKMDFQVAKLYAKAQNWPMNFKACHKFDGCQFRNVCSLPANVRQTFLDSNFVKRTWDPRKER